MNDGRTTRYDATTDAVVYDCDRTASFTPADWARLALAALDQAGVSPEQLARAHRAARGRTEATLFDLDLVAEVA